MAWNMGGTPPGMDAILVKRIQNPKAPTDIIPITIDFRGPLNILDGDALNTTIVPVISLCRNDDAVNDLTFIPPAQFSTDATRITCWFAAGTATYEYLVSITVQSVLGQTLERSFILPVYIR